MAYLATKSLHGTMRQAVGVRVERFQIPHISHVNVSIHELTQRSLRNLRNDDALVDLLYSMFVQSC
jgi:hypothetical protein